MARSPARHSSRIQTTKPAAAEPATAIQPAPKPAPLEVTPLPGTAERAPWVVLMLWLTAFLGLFLTIWYDLIYGIFFK